MPRTKGKSPARQSKSKPRWECYQVTLTPVPLDAGDWQDRLETLTQELYDFGHQLQDDQTSKRVLDDHRSHSTIHLRASLDTQTPTAQALGEEGARNGNDSTEHAA